MNLMTLVRLLVAVVVGWTAVSLSAGVLGVIVHQAPEQTFFLPRPALEEAISVGKLDSLGRLEYNLLDQTNGGVEPLTLPETDAWSLLSVSPWRNKDGALEAAGRWVSRGASDDEAFCGIGFLTFPGSTVKKRVTLDVLPTGRPCWLPARPGEILFPAGDGQLYRCNIADRNRKEGADRSRVLPEKKEGKETEAQAVNWDTETPGAGVVVLSDPAVVPELGLSHLVFVALGAQEWRDGRRANLPTKLWWLAMNDQGDAIVDAGRLVVPDSDNAGDDHTYERCPNVVARPDGKINLVYLDRIAPESLWQLRSCTLEIDSKTSLPRRGRDVEPMTLAKQLRSEPLVLSAKGDTVYAVDRDGQIVQYSIPK
jgi:hypothetical protein